MVYIFGLAIVFIVIVIVWCIRAIIIAITNYLAHKRDPSLPMPVSTQPSLGTTAENVFGRFIRATMPGADELEPPPPVAQRRRSSVYSGVVRAHPECGSDPDLPKYSSCPTASRPELIIIEDDNLPPPLTPRSNTPTPASPATSTTALAVPEAAPGYTTRPATPVLPMASVASAPATMPQVTFAQGGTPMPAPPPRTRRKPNQRGGPTMTSAFMFVSI